MRSIPILDLKAQLASYRDRALEAMTEVMDSQYFIMGPGSVLLRRHSVNGSISRQQWAFLQNRRITRRSYGA